MSSIMPKKLKVILSCNFNNSKSLKKGVVGDREALKLLTVKNVKSFALPHGWSEYEENVEFDKMEITLKDNSQILFAGYSGFWEILCYNDLKRKAQSSVLTDICDWAEWHFENC